MDVKWVLEIWVKAYDGWRKDSKRKTGGKQQSEGGLDREIE